VLTRVSDTLMSALSKLQRHGDSHKAERWTLDQKDSADTIRIIAILILWAAFSFLIFVAQGEWFLNLVCSLLIVASVGGLAGTFPGIRFGSILPFLFRTSLAIVAIFVVLYVTLGTFEGSFEDDYAASRCSNTTKTWRRNNFCTDSMSDTECEKTCKSTVGKDLQIEMILCSTMLSAALLYSALEVYRAEITLYPKDSETSV